MSRLRVVTGLALLLPGLVALPVTAQDFKPQIEPGAVPVPRGDLFIRDLDAVWTATGEVLEGASILIRDGKVRALGPGLDAPAGVPVLEGRGLTALPGFVDQHSHIAMHGTNEGTSPVVPEVRVIDALDPEDFGIYRALSGGVTTAQVLHGSSNPIGGQSAIIKTRWGMDDPMKLLVQGAPQTVKFALGENVTRKNRSGQGVERYPSSRAGVEALYVQAFSAARDYQRAWEEYRGDPRARPAPPRRDLRLEALGEILDGRIRVHAHSYRADEILMLMRVAERFGFRIDCFTHVLEGYKVADEMAEHGACGSTFSDWWHYKLEAFDAIPHNAAIMHRHGVLTSLNSDIPWLQSFFTFELQKPVRYGDVSREEALRMLTLYPARQLLLEDRVGSLEVGKDGDVVLLNGDPFDVYSRVETTVVDGIVYFDLDRDAELRGEPVRALPAAGQPVARAPSAGADGAADGGSGATGASGAAGGADGKSGAPPGTNGGPDVAGTGGAALGSSGAPAAVVALVGATVHPVSGPDIPEGVVVVRDGRIAAVGRPGAVPVPEDATLVDLAGRHVYPGMIDPLTQVGMVDIGSVPSAQDAREVGEYNPHVRGLFSIHPVSAPIEVTRANGITAVMSVHERGVIPGTGSVVQLAGDTPERMAVRDRAALVVNLPRPPGEAWEEAKLEGPELEELVALFERARLYASRPSTRRGPTDPFDAQSAGDEAILLEALAPALTGELPVFFRVRTEREIRTMLLFLDSFPEVRGAVVGGDQAYRLAEELAGRSIPVVVGSGLRPTMDRYDPVDAGWRNASILHAAGVKVSFSTQDAADVRNLPYHAARSAAFGLPRDAALRAVTLGAAEVLGVADSMGSIETGKRADLIVTDGDPLQITTRVERMWIAGEEVSLDSKHTRLYEAYKDRRGGAPR